MLLLCDKKATGRPAVSLPNGARSLPVELLPSLERFESIYLWLDDDVAGQEGVELFAKKLGLDRTYIVHSSSKHAASLASDRDDGDGDGDAPKSPKDANDALRAGADLEALINAAKPVPHEQIATFGDLRASILRELENPAAVRTALSLSLSLSPL